MIFSTQASAVKHPNGNYLNKLKGASSIGDVSQVMELLSRGVDINMIDAMEKSSLHHASLKSLSPTFKQGHSFFTGDRSRDGHLRVVKHLVENGADVNMRDHHGFTPLHLSVRGGHLDIAAYLLEEGEADVNLPAKSGYTPLASAAENGNLDIVDYLIDHGADLDSSSVSGSTVVLNAVKNGHIDVVRCLGERGADLNKADLVGRTPLYYASKLRNPEIVDYLIDATSCSTVRSTSFNTAEVQRAFVNISGIKTFTCRRLGRTMDPVFSDGSSDEESNSDNIVKSKTAKDIGPRRKGRQSNTASRVSRSWILFKELS